MPYADDTFDYVYARLVLHYLGKSDLENAVREIYRVLKPQGKLYVAVKSDKELTYKEVPVKYDADTNMTGIADPMDAGKLRYRQFMSPQSVKNYLRSFKVISVDEFQEQTYHDYGREVKAESPATLVEAIAQKA
jgi:ubiquinone/menaquinone biosynthesis C-methylase UbiE